MNKYIENRILEESNYIIKTQNTIRETAKNFNVSKSTVHKDVSYRLIELKRNVEMICRFTNAKILCYKNKYEEVAKILKYHTDIRHLRGGESTKRKYLSNKVN